MIEVEVKIPNCPTFEYQALAAPREGEHLDISTDYVDGIFLVKKVSHRIFTSKKTGKTMSYVKVEAELEK